MAKKVGNIQVVDGLKLMKWGADRFPPINLGDHFMNVVDLVREVWRLRKEVEDLKNQVTKNQK